MPTLKVFVNEATNLFGADLDGNSDPYCVLKIGEGNQFSAIEKTRVIKNTKNPTWKECFTLNVNNPLNEFLFLEVWNKESSSKDNSLGYAQLPLNDLARGVEKQVWIQLEGGTQGSNIIGQIASHLGKKKGEKTNHGKVFLGITALDFGLDPSLQQQQFGQGVQQPGMMGQQGMQQPGMIGQQQQGIHQQGIQQPGMQQPGMQQGMQQPGMVGQHSQQSGLSSQQSGLSGQQSGMSGQAGSYGQQSGSGYSQQQPSVYPPSSGGVQGSHSVNTPQMPSTTMPSSTQPPIDPSQQHKHQQQSAYPQDL
jgi:hypothetical protein